MLQLFLIRRLLHSHSIRDENQSSSGVSYSLLGALDYKVLEP